MKYIDAEKLIAEIERRIEETKSMKPTFDQFWAGQISAFKGALKIVKSLQQEQPEVDLEKEITPSLVENMLCEFGVQSIDDMDSENLAEFARHFWNEGYNARKEGTK